MSPEETSFLNLRTLPARLSPEQTAWYLGCSVENLRILIRAGLLKPLGKPAPNATKFFALGDLAQLRADSKSLARLTEAIQVWHRRKNGRGGGALRPTLRPGSSRSQPVCRSGQPSAPPFSNRPPCRAGNRGTPAAKPSTRQSSADAGCLPHDAPAPDDDPSTQDE